MGKITDALKKVKDERIARIQKKPEVQYVTRRIENTSIDEHVVSFHDPSSPVGEQYKMLRTTIQSLKTTKNYKTFMITSSTNGEGKTITSTNLAISMAQDLNNKSILLIDADIRKGRIARYLGLNHSPGLSEILKGEIEEDACFVNPNIPNLTVICSGKTPKNPSELLNSKRMAQLINSLKARFDYILIDTPPVMPLTDACILAPMVDGVMMVVQAGRTQRDIVRNAESKLIQAYANVLGFVMTNVEYHLPHYLYRYVHDYHAYAYKETPANS
jgi:capsular exopolysaccharide synthesis family protein